MFNLKDIISSIADAGKKLFKKSTVVKKNDVETIITLCDDLLSNIKLCLMKINCYFLKRLTKNINQVIVR